jgi:tRNA-Thr(GGU) m(6)t(6)A37 methyltransferase TsaA
MVSNLTFIGVVHSKLISLADCPLQESEDAPQAIVEIFPEFVEGIKSLNPGSKIIVLTWLHQADRSVIECIPRREYDAPKIGVFSTRSPDRPNPIGLHEAKVVSIADGKITVSALEVLDGTPVVDIKPKL